MPLARECTRGFYYPWVPAATAIGADRQAAEATTVSKENNGAARATAARTVIVCVESRLAVRCNFSRACDRACVDNDDATTRTAAAENTRAGGCGSCAAGRGSCVRGVVRTGYVIRAVVGRAGAAAAAHDDCIRGGREQSAAEPAFDGVGYRKAVPPKASNTSDPAVAACAAAGVIRVT